MIEQEIYINSVNQIIELTKKRVSKEVYMTEIQLAKEFVKLANETEENLLHFLKENNKRVISYSIKKLQLITDNGEQDENDDYILEEEEEEEEEEDSETMSLGLSKTFLIDDTLELMLIKKEDDSLEKYLKKIRIPNAKKYAQELREIYNSTQKE